MLYQVRYHHHFGRAQHRRACYGQNSLFEIEDLQINLFDLSIVQLDIYIALNFFHISGPDGAFRLVS